MARGLPTFGPTFLRKEGTTSLLGHLLIVRSYWKLTGQISSLMIAEEQIEKTEYVTKDYFAADEDKYFVCAAKICDKFQKQQN